MVSLRSCRIGVIGLGYVGLPLAVEFGQRFATFGFDVPAKRTMDFFSGYSPERINPGNQHHRLANIRKVTAGSDGRR